MDSRTIVYVGNFRPAHSTENHVATAFRAGGHTVIQLQEDDPESWTRLLDPGWVADTDPDLVLWTRTWHLPDFDQLGALAALADAGVPTVGYHLDRWWGLPREHQVADEPFFRCDLMITADGGHDERWAEAGVNHLWLPPGVLGVECHGLPAQRANGRTPVGFVGSWQHYHPEWPWRRELVNHLRRHYGRRFRSWPTHPHVSVRGAALAAVYSRVDVVVGDSCLAGGATRYWSDRIPETLGRGGFLIHPEVEGLSEHFTPGEHLVTVPVADWDAMRDAIDYWLERPLERRQIASAGREHVLAHHTYEKRTEQILEAVEMMRAGEGGTRTARRGRVRAVFDLRPDSTDELVVHETWTENVYALEPEDVAGRVVLDLGANIGAFTLWAAAAGASSVLAVEPAPANADCLEANLALNDRLTCAVDVLRVAVGDHSGKAQFTYNETEAGGSHLGGSPGAVTVELWTLADLVAAAGGHVDVVKIDVEGGEYDALTAAGADGTLALVDRIVGEWHTLPDDESAGAWLRELLSYGTLRIFGDPIHGGQFDWVRYGA